MLEDREAPGLNNSHRSGVPIKVWSGQRLPENAEEAAALGHWDEWHRAKAQLDRFLEALRERNGSDLHIRTLGPAFLEVGKRFEPLSWDGAPAAPMLLFELLLHYRYGDEWEPRRHINQALTERSSYDVAVNVGSMRLRVNCCAEVNGWSLVARRLPSRPPDLTTLGFEPGIVDDMLHCVRKSRGLFIVSGPMGSGKTTTQAALLWRMLEIEPRHIITLEDPIEIYLPKDELPAPVTQREIGVSAPSYAVAMADAMRQAGKVIVVGEARKREEFERALQLAEVGHLVVMTMHTRTATRSLGRWLSLFPDQREFVRDLLADNLLAILSQELLPRADGEGVALCYEYMPVSGVLAVENAIREGSLGSLATGLRSGHRRFALWNDQLNALEDRGWIDSGVAAAARVS